MIRCSAVQLRQSRSGATRVDFTYFIAVAERIAKLQFLSESEEAAQWKPPEINFRWSLPAECFNDRPPGTTIRAVVIHFTSAVNISKDLAQLGILAANLGRKVSEVGKHHEHEDFSRLQPLAIAVSHLCRQTLRSLVRLDPVLARNAAQGGASVDAYRDYVLRGLSKPEPHVPESQVKDEQDLHLIFASRCLEQIADSAIHLAGNLVIFLDDQQDSQSMASRSPDLLQKKQISHTHNTDCTFKLFLLNS